MAVSERQRLEANLRKEIDGAALYQAMAGAEKNPKLAEVYRRLSAVEAGHAEVWREQLAKEFGQAPDPRPGWRTRVLAALVRRFGVQTVLPTLVSLEEVDSHGYDAQPDARAVGLPGEERSHARLLRQIAGGSGGLEGGFLAQIEGRHRRAGGNALRAAVLGASDGLLSNLSLVMGVAGAQMEGRAVLVSGIAGLLAGAFSMALGEWLSVQSSRELYTEQLRTEREEVAARPEEEAEELTLIYEAKGLAPEHARSLADQMMSEPAQALDTLAREELGIDPEELGGSAWEAAATSFVLFAGGAIVPVLPFLFLSSSAAMVTSVALSAAALFAIGAGITLFTGRGVLYSGTRQVLFGLAAAAVTFGVGRLIGARIAG